jgi:peptide/nickel transport system permease protein
MRLMGWFGWGGVTLILLTGLAFIEALFHYGTGSACDPSRTNLVDALRSPFSRASEAVTTSCMGGIYLLGTDALGRDLLLRLLQGIRTVLLVGVGSVAISQAFGVLTGLMAGYWGHVRLLPRRVGGLTVDTLITGIIDVFLSFPSLFLYLVVATVVTSSVDRAPNLATIIVVVVATSWMEVARLTRAEVLSNRRRQYVEHAEMLHTSGALVAVRHLLPHALPPLLVSATLGVAQVILFESTLSFIGAGPPSAELASLGNIIADAQGYFEAAPWLVAVPSLTICVIVLSLNAIAVHMQDSLRRSSIQHEVGHA